MLVLQVFVQRHQKPGIRHFPHNKRRVSPVHNNRRYEHLARNLREIFEFKSESEQFMYGTCETLLRLPE